MAPNRPREQLVMATGEGPRVANPYEYNDGEKIGTSRLPRRVADRETYC